MFRTFCLDVGWILKYVAGYFGRKPLDGAPVQAETAWSVLSEMNVLACGL